MPVFQNRSQCFRARVLFPFISPLFLVLTRDGFQQFSKIEINVNTHVKGCQQHAGSLVSFIRHNSSDRSLVPVVCFLYILLLLHIRKITSLKYAIRVFLFATPIRVYLVPVLQPHKMCSTFQNTR